RYDADDGWAPYAELTATYRLSDSWSVYGSGRYTHLSDEAKDSPMVDRSWSALLSTGVTYTF
ncbi:MipA/OmpV family protein, partial [Leptospira borgpetersenii serovar Hardjo-bovis]|nr:MipA/OmpV family protein [Leptospira borgpetersenii serovar Hardjo-bovis]